MTVSVVFGPRAGQITVFATEELAQKYRDSLYERTAIRNDVEVHEKPIIAAYPIKVGG